MALSSERCVNRCNTILFKRKTNTYSIKKHSDAFNNRSNIWVLFGIVMSSARDVQFLNFRSQGNRKPVLKQNRHVFPDHLIARSTIYTSKIMQAYTIGVSLFLTLCKVLSHFSLFHMSIKYLLHIPEMRQRSWYSD